VIPRFSRNESEAKAYLDEHGFVVLGDVLAADELARVQRGWDSVVRDAANSLSLPEEEFVARFPQNRDLWRKSEDFRGLLFETQQWRCASQLLGVSGVRLFHDHAICKPTRRSATIPWHQDSAYWPLDRVGLSLWTPVNDVPLDGGCLKVLDGSHRDGPGEPQDFLGSSTVNHDADSRLVSIPVNRGETVVLNGLTWHGSAPNEGGPERIAYLTLWVPATSRFRPEHARWHPTTANIHVAPGEHLTGEWFPLFGNLAAFDEGQEVIFPPPKASSGPSMFSASSDIGAQLARLLGCERRSMAEMLDEHGQDAVVSRSIANALIGQHQEPVLRTLLRDLVLQEQVRKQSTARDVYLQIVARWWNVIGKQLNETQQLTAVENSQPR